MADCMASAEGRPPCAISLLPPPHRGAAEPGLARHFQDRQALGGRQDDLRALRTVAVANNGEQSFGQ